MMVVIIPAQGKSRRLPGKNMREIEGKPLLYWAIDAARRSTHIEKIIVTTDDHYIAEYARSQDVSVIMRGEDLCGDAPVVEVYKDAMVKSGLRGITHVVAIQPDHPDRSTDIDAAIELVVERNISDFITTDRYGVRHGSVRIMKSQDLLEGRLSYTSGAWVDNCINVHTEKDLRRAEASFIRNIRPLIIGNFALSEDGPTFIVAEAWINHDKGLEAAIRAIDQAKKAGADAIKFQIHNAGTIVSKANMQCHKPSNKTDFEDFRVLFEYCIEKDLIFLTTTFDCEFADFSEGLGLSAFMIDSCDLQDVSLIRHIASKRRPVMISTGACTLEEIRHAVDTILEAGNRDIILLQPIPASPIKGEDVSIRRIETVKGCFPETIVGISDYTFPDESMTFPTAAVALGAKVVEKHYTFCHNQPAKNYQYSIDSHLLERMVQNIRVLEKALGYPDEFITNTHMKKKEI
ncbi:MAG: N-acetylneuraminate synthase family protein [Thermodesulfobacteriota bacterium]|nr:N-acetylneuraminate synthase family protein [Thermodesulfobacteriota bacterium]